VLVIHHEPEDTTARTAPEAVERLARGIHMAGGTLLLVKRADGTIARSGTLEWEVTADDLHDVAGIGDLADTLLGYSGHGMKD